MGLKDKKGALGRKGASRAEQRPAFPSVGCECASFKLGDLGTDCHFLNSSFHLFSANTNEMPIDFHMLDSFGWDFSSA